MGSHKFERLVSKIPVGNEKLLGIGMRYFFEMQEPESVNLTIHNNGYSIDVETRDEKVEDAIDFWENNIEGRL